MILELAQDAAGRERVHQRRVDSRANVDEAIENFERTDAQYGYSVAWIDCVSAKSALGRSILHVGDFATRDQLPRVAAQNPLSRTRRSSPIVPFNLPELRAQLAERARVQLGQLRDPSQRKRRSLLRLGQFFLSARFDSQLEPNLRQARLRAVSMRVAARGEPRGPDRNARSDQRSRRASFLAVLKKFGAQEGLLSFPMPGYTLALDFPVTDGLLEFLDSLDAMVLKRGGRVYLAKDARMRPETFRAMYPNLQGGGGEGEADPNNHFSSTLSRGCR